MSNSFPLRRILLIAGAGLAIGAGSWLASRYAPIDLDALEEAEPTSSEPAEAPPPPPVVSTSVEPAPVTPDPVRVIEARDPGRSPLADDLNAPAGTIRADLEILRDVLANYRLALETDPVGNNAEITAQLTGRNPRRHAPIPQDHPAIDAAGQLRDRWGTPFHFHSLSRRETEIRSAGPDRDFYTADDVVWSPGPRDIRDPIARQSN